jgi:hypothetical protein
VLSHIITFSTAGMESHFQSLAINSLGVARDDQDNMRLSNDGASSSRKSPALWLSEGAYEAQNFKRSISNASLQSLSFEPRSRVNTQIESIVGRLGE